MGEPVLVEFPRHLYIPKGAQSLDFRRVCVVAAGSTTPTLLWEWTCPEGSNAFFIAYGIFNDGLDETLTQFFPTVNGSRIFPYHGNPMRNFAMSLGLAPDLSEGSLIRCQLTLKPNQKIAWHVTNNDTVEVNMGARMVGYLAPMFGVSTSGFGS